MPSMAYLPDRETFQQLAGEFPLVPVYRRLLSDALTPVSAFHALDHGGSACPGASRPLTIRATS